MSDGLTGMVESENNRLRDIMRLQHSWIVVKAFEGIYTVAYYDETKTCRERVQCSNLFNGIHQIYKRLHEQG